MVGREGRWLLLSDRSRRHERSTRVHLWSCAVVILIRIAMVTLVNMVVVTLSAPQSRRHSGGSFAPEAFPAAPPPPVVRLQNPAPAPPLPHQNRQQAPAPLAPQQQPNQNHQSHLERYMKASASVPGGGIVNGAATMAGPSSGFAAPPVGAAATAAGRASWMGAVLPSMAGSMGAAFSLVRAASAREAGGGSGLPQPQQAPPHHHHQPLPPQPSPGGGATTAAAAFTRNRGASECLMMERVPNPNLPRLAAALRGNSGESSIDSFMSNSTAGGGGLAGGGMGGGGWGGRGGGGVANGGKSRSKSYSNNNSSSDGFAFPLHIL